MMRPTLRVLVATTVATVLVTGETLVEHEYGMDSNQMDDGTEYTPHVEVPRTDPTFAQGYFLTDAAKADDAVCLDGTPNLYYHRKGTGSGANKWFLHQEGGGWCYDLASCAGRSMGKLGSTKDDADTSSLNGGWFSMDPEDNPLLYNWNAVELRYCDGASLAGDKPTPTMYENTTLHFRGRAILDAQIASLLNERGMNSATDVVVSGASAGGLAAFLHCDKWADEIANATQNKAKVVCVPDSGFFLDEDRSPMYGSNMRNVYKFQEASSAGLNAACVQAHTATGDPEKCIFAQWSSQYTKTPTFPFQSQYDVWQMYNVMGKYDTPNYNISMNEFGQNLTGLIQTLLLNQPQHGVYNDACHRHVGGWDGPVIDGMNIAHAVEAWYNKGSAGLPNKGFFYQDKKFHCDACCSGTG